MDIIVKLTFGQYNDFGKVLNHLYYFNKSLLEMAPNRCGYPHNGGEHSLRIEGNRGECLAFIELLNETYKEKYPRINQALCYLYQDIASEKDKYSFDIKKYRHLIEEVNLENS